MMTVSSFREYYTDKSYIVKDIVPKGKAKLILVLESPHKTEIKTKIPISGKSGSNISSWVFNKSQYPPFGIYINNHLCSEIAIINVSKVPLQETDSCPYDISFKRLNTIRKKNKFSGQILTIDIMKIIKCDFQNRFKKTQKTTDCEIIACGNFAKLYCEELNMEYRLINIPHPSSRKGWQNSQSMEAVEKIRKIRPVVCDYIL